MNKRTKIVLLSAAAVISFVLGISMRFYFQSSFYASIPFIFLGFLFIALTIKILDKPKETKKIRPVPAFRLNELVKTAYGTGKVLDYQEGHMAGYDHARFVYKVETLSGVKIMEEDEIKIAR